MRVFVTGTGRCGTSTCYHAFSFAKNYTSGHETKVGWDHLGDFEYPDNHIEVSPHLSVCVPILRKKYSLFLVHMIRDRSDCVNSLATGVPVSMKRYARNWWQARARRMPVRSAGAFYDTINALIESYKPDFTLRLETAKEQWPELWSAIGAEGDFESSLAVWDRKYNSHAKRGRDEFV